MISFVLPVYNCYQEFEAGLSGFVRSVKMPGEAIEIIVVDDGSREGERFRVLAEGNECIYLRNEQNCGKGYAVKRGIETARGQLLVFMDGDFPFLPGAVERMIRVLREGDFDMVIGDRTLELSRFSDDIPFLRRAGSKVLSHITGNYFTPGFYDTQCGLKGFRKEAAGRIFQAMTLRGFSFDIEVLHIALKSNYAIGRIPVDTRKQATSNVRIFIHGAGTIAALVKIVINDALGKYGS